MNESLDGQLNLLTRQQLIRPDASELESAYRFQHVLTQETAYSGLLLRRRKNLHLDIASILERASDSSRNVSLLAYHYWLGEAWLPAGEWAMRAGDQAMQVYALREAIMEYEHAMTAFDHAPEATDVQRIDAVLAWSQAAFKFRPRAEILQRVLRAEALARELDDKPRLARTLEEIANINLAQGYPSRARPALTQIYELAQQIGDERMLVSPTFNLGIFAMDDDPQAGMQYLERALELARRYGDRDIEAYTLGTQGMLFARLGRFEEAERASQAALALLDQLRSPLTESDIYLFAGWLNLSEENFPEALKYGQLGLQKAEEADNVECVCYGYACVGFGNLQSQKLPGAINAFRESVRRSQFSGVIHVEVLARVGLATAEFFAGKHEAVNDLEQAFEDAQNIGQTYVAAQAAQVLGMIYLQMGDLKRAEERLNYARDFYQTRELKPSLERTMGLLKAVEAKS